jgi:hypothetical protein
MIAQFPFMAAFENRSFEGDVESSYHYVLNQMRNFFSALTYEQKFDDPSEEVIDRVRQSHRDWCAKFDNSNLYILDGKREGFKTTESNFNPQAAPS